MNNVFELKLGRKIQDYCKDGNLSAIQALPGMHEFVEFVDENGPFWSYTPIIIACEYGHAEIVKYLLDLGASFAYVTPQGSHALLASARTGGYECVRVLLNRGAQVMVNVLYGGCISPLCTAIANRSPKTEDECLRIVRALIDVGADINHRGIYEKTPLLLALESEMFLVAKALLEAGAKFSQLHYQYDEVLSGLGYEPHADCVFDDIDWFKQTEIEAYGSQHGT